MQSVYLYAMQVINGINNEHDTTEGDVANISILLALLMSQRGCEQYLCTCVRVVDVVITSFI